MEPIDVSGMTTEELTSNLVTSDYRGQTFKKACLDEILRRNGHAHTPIDHGVGVVREMGGNLMVLQTNIDGKYVGYQALIEVFAPPQNQA